MTPLDDQGRLQQLFQSVMQCHHAMLTASSEDALLAEVCRLVCDGTAFHAAWVGYKVDDGAQTISPMASDGLDDSQLFALELSWGVGPAGQHPAGTAVRSNQPVYVGDMESETGDWAEAARAQGCHSIVAVPLIMDSGDVLGVLCAGSERPGAVGEHEVALLGQLAADLAFGISVFRQRATLVTTDRMFRAAFDCRWLAALLHPVTG